MLDTDQYDCFNITSSPLVQRTVRVDLLVPCEPYHVADLVYNALVVLILRTHHHGTKDACKNGSHGHGYVPGTQPDHGGCCAAKKGAYDALHKLPLSKTIEQFIIRFHPARDIKRPLFRLRISSFLRAFMCNNTSRYP